MTAPLLELTEVRKSFGRTEIIRGATLTVRQGEIHALIGPNGAGKSTLFHLISGRLPVTSGQIVFQGRDITGERPATIARLGLARSFQQTLAFRDMSVAENIAVAAMRANGEVGSILKPVSAMASVWHRVTEVMELLNLTRFKGQPASSLAYSDQRALEIAIAIAPDPALVLLDEPTAGMSRAETGSMIDAIRLIARGRTLVLVEHDMNVVFGLAQTVSVLVYGEVLISASPDVVRADARVRAAYLGQTEQVVEAAHG
ncbi:MAG: ABC transporter ATP-binding protein [Bosea sp. (in: a-proteobacteria)]|jgi:branched-chain amino acid transport system ATP-binding protein